MGYSTDATIGYGIVVPNEWEEHLEEFDHDIDLFLWGARKRIEETHGTEGPYSWDSAVNLETHFCGTLDDPQWCILASETIIRADWNYPTQIEQWPEQPTPEDFVHRLVRACVVAEIPVIDDPQPGWLVCVSWG